MITRLILFLCFIFFFNSQSGAQPKSSQILELSGKKQWDRFGSSLALQNDVALIRAKENIYFYKHELDTWDLKQVFQGHDSSDDAFSFFGESIDIDNEFVVCGDRKANSGNVKNPGAAYVFKYDGESWTEFDKLVPDDLQEDKNFAVDVSIDDDLIVVGAHHYDNRGAAYVYRYVDCTWVQEAKLIPSDAEDYMAFGWRVDVDSSRIVVGTFQQNSAYIFEHINGSWVETANIKKNSRRFGSEVAIKGRNVLISARNESPDPNEISTLSVLSGAVYHYEKRGASWEQVKRMVPSRWGAELFGSSIAMSDSELAVVSRVNDTSEGSSQGLISFYQIGGSNKPKYEMTYSIGATGDRWGGVVELDGNNIIYAEVDVDSSVIESTGLVHIYNDRIEENLLIENVDKIDPYCAEEGSISVNTTGGIGAIEYSVDGGASYFPSSQFSNLSAGDYEVYAKDQQNNIYRQCVALDDIAGLEIEITETVLPTCELDIGGVSFKGVGGRSPYQYSLDGIEFQDEVKFENLGQGDYSGFISDNDGCIDTVSFSLVAESDFEITSVQSANAKCKESNGSLSIDYQGAVGEVNYLINGSIQGEGAHIENLPTGNYHILLVDEAQCESEMHYEILDDDCPIYIPNIFSPHGEGINDRFRIFTPTNFDGKDIRVSIHDRWGGVIYEKENFEPGVDYWDGTSQLKNLNNGVYVITLSYTASDGELIHRREAVTLSR